MLVHHHPWDTVLALDVGEYEGLSRGHFPWGRGALPLGTPTRASRPPARPHLMQVANLGPGMSRVRTGAACAARTSQPCTLGLDVVRRSARSGLAFTQLGNRAFSVKPAC